MCTHNSSGTSSSATPTANQSNSSRSSRFLLSSFWLHPHYCYHAVYLAVRKLRCPKQINARKNTRTYLYILRQGRGSEATEIVFCLYTSLSLFDNKVTPISGRWAVVREVWHFPKASFIGHYYTGSSIAAWKRQFDIKKTKKHTGTEYHRVWYGRWGPL